MSSSESNQNREDNEANNMNNESERNSWFNWGVSAANELWNYVTGTRYMLTLKDAVKDQIKERKDYDKEISRQSRDAAYKLNFFRHHILDEIKSQSDHIYATGSKLFNQTFYPSPEHKRINLKCEILNHAEEEDFQMNQALFINSDTITYEDFVFSIQERLEDFSSRGYLIVSLIKQKVSQQNNTNDTTLIRTDEDVSQLKEDDVVIVQLQHHSEKKELLY